MNLEEDIEPYLDKKICLRYWDTSTDHADFRAIINAIYKAVGDDVIIILIELEKAGFVIRKI